MKRRISAALALLLALCLLCGVWAEAKIVSPSDVLYVSDYASVLSDETEKEIVSSVESLKALCGGEIAVVTIRNLTGGLDSEEYAYEIINQWGVGDAKKQNGTVLLLVPGEGKAWITTGTGAERFLSAGTLDSILNRYFWDDFDAGDYDAAVRNTFAALISAYESNYGISVDSAYSGYGYEEEYYGEPYAPVSPIRSFFSVIGGILKVVLCIVIFLAIIFLLSGGGGGRGRRGGGTRWIIFPGSFGRRYYDPWRRPPGGPPPPGGFGGRPGGRPGGGFGGGRPGGGFGGGRPGGGFGGGRPGGGFGGGGHSGGFGGGGHSGGFGGGGGRGGGAGRR